MESFSARKRAHFLREMADAELDVFVVGGGITGAGIAWDASVRGMRVGLAEMNDFASGTSSRSTKLIHGGLRYLKQGEVRLVREVGRERALLHRRVPYLVDPIPMLLPIYKKGTYGYWASSVGLYVYDMLAGVKRGERRKMYSRKKTGEMEPLLKPEGLKGSGYYYEYRTDDARLTIEIIKSARRNGALLANYAKVTQFIYKQAKVVGVKVEDRITGETYDIYAKKIVNAAGPWGDDIRGMDKSLTGKHLLLTKGVHLVVNAKRLPVNQAAYFDVPGGRMIFVIPRGTKTYFGTTDTVYKGDPQRIKISKEDRDYLLHAVNHAFPAVKLRPSDIEAGWAGVRPLIHEEGKGPSEVSRKDEIFISDKGLITIAGGKLTGFRKMAEKVVDLVARQLLDEKGNVYPPCSTDRQPVSGGIAREDESFHHHKARFVDSGRALGLNADQALDLLSRYGSNTDVIYSYLTEDHAKQTPISEKLLHAEVIYSVHHEMTVTICDFLVRRTGWVYFDRHRAKQSLELALTMMGELLEWDKAETAKQRAAAAEQLKLSFE